MDKKVEKSEQEKKLMREEFAKLTTVNITRRRNRLSSLGWRSATINILSEEKLDAELDSSVVNDSYLREVSKALYIKSSQYRRMVNYFAEASTLDWLAVPSEDTDLKTYRAVVSDLERINIKHEFVKIMKSVFKEGSYYGLVIENKESVHFHKVDAKDVILYGVVDGIFTIGVATHFFELEDISMYSSELRMAIVNARQNNEPYVIVPYKDSIAIKADEDSEVSVPPMAGSFRAILELEKYKKLRKVRDKLNTYKILVQKIPLQNDKNSNRADNFAIEADTATAFHEMFADSLPEEIQLVTTPMEVEDITVRQNQNSETDNVSNAEANFWNSNGVSEVLFGKANNNVGIKYSLKVDETMVFAILRQLERWVNIRIKDMAGKKNKVRFKILDITYYNRDEYIELLLKTAQFGLPVKLELASALGYNPREAIDMMNFENNTLKLHENMIPLMSSHVGAEGQGRPEDKSGETTEGADRAQGNTE